MKFLSLALFLTLPLTAQDLTKIRNWKNNAGKVIKAKLISTNADKVTLETLNGKRATIKISVLSNSDQELIKKWSKQNKSQLHAGASSTTGSVPQGPFRWKSNFSGDATPEVKYVQFDDKRKAHLYKTKHFDFYIEQKMTNSTVSKCVAVFDNIVDALNEFPIGLKTVPDGSRPRYETILCASQARYMQLGGVPNSGGFFDPRRNLTVIPFTSMGIVQKGNNFVFDGKKRDFSTLVHELVHHCTSHWRAQPTWIVEGMADYMSAMPYRSGSFNFSNTGGYIAAQIRKYTKTTVGYHVVPKGVLQAITPERMLTVSRREWNMTLIQNQAEGSRYYASSMVYFYYFARVDGRGDGKYLIQYMHTLENARKNKKQVDQKAMIEKFLLRGRSYEELKTDMKNDLKSKGLKINFR